MFSQLEIIGFDEVIRFVLCLAVTDGRCFRVRADIRDFRGEVYRSEDEIHGIQSSCREAMESSRIIFSLSIAQ